MRGADSGPWNRICALPAFWTGLLYDDTALDAAWDMVKDFRLAEIHALRDGVPRRAFKLPFRNGTVLDLARSAVQNYAHGMACRRRRKHKRRHDQISLRPAKELVTLGHTA